jgi:hypothetical protein
MAKTKANYLTAETNKMWAASIRDEKNGRYDPRRAHRRCFEWAAWRLAQSGVELPEDAKPSLVGNRVEYRRTVQPPATKVDRWTWRHHAPRVEVVASVEIPSHCYPTHDAEEWMLRVLGAPMFGELEAA